MRIFLIDHTAGRMQLAVPFLATLNDLKREVWLKLTTEQRVDYGRLFRLFENLHIWDKPFDPATDDIFIDIVESSAVEFEYEKNRHLIFPIILAENIQEYQKSVESNQLTNRLFFTPVAAHNAIGKYLAGDFQSAPDILQRLMTGVDLAELRILISAGATAEDIDPVRFITNRSTGRMGIALARAAYIRGAEVKLVLGPAQVSPPAYLNTCHVRSAANMAEQIFNLFPDCDVYIAAAAVADYTPTCFQSRKIKKQQGGLTLELKRTTDILSAIKELRTHQLVVGFSVETDDELANSQKKLIDKNLDLIIINNPNITGAGFAAETNLVTLLGRDGKSRSLPLLTKFEVSNFILTEVLAALRSRNRGN